MTNNDVGKRGSEASPPDRLARKTKDDAATLYASCKWCGVKTGILKTDAHFLGAMCSDKCLQEIKEHYT